MVSILGWIAGWYRANALVSSNVLPHRHRYLAFALQFMTR